MVRLDLSARGVCGVRFRLSPVGELAASVRQLAAPRLAPVTRHWLRRCGNRLDAQDVASLRAVLPLGGRPRTPRILSPAPDVDHEPIERLLVRLSNMSGDELRADVLDAWTDRPPAGTVRLLDDPEAPRQLAASIERYWQAAITPFWPRMLEVLDAEVRRRGLVAARHGPLSTLSDVHSSVTVHGSTVSVTDCQVTLSGPVDELVLFPSIFVWPRPVVSQPAPGVVTLQFGARGLGTVFDPADPAEDPADGLLGDSRATVLRLLAEPSTTTTLARIMGRSSGTTNRHLTILRDAGLVSAHREGRQVLYRQTLLGRALLETGRDRRARREPDR